MATFLSPFSLYPSTSVGRVNPSCPTPLLLSWKSCSYRVLSWQWWTLLSAVVLIRIHVADDSVFCKMIQINDGPWTLWWCSHWLTIRHPNQPCKVNQSVEDTLPPQTSTLILHIRLCHWTNLIALLLDDWTASNWSSVWVKGCLTWCLGGSNACNKTLLYIAAEIHSVVYWSGL